MKMFNFYLIQYLSLCSTVNCYIVKILVINLNKLLFFRLKRTTDVMFGGKQVIICGYGEVSQRGITLTTFGENLTKVMKLSIVKLFFKFMSFNSQLSMI